MPKFDDRQVDDRPKKGTARPLTEGKRVSVGDGRRKRDVEEIEGELGQGITRRRAFLDIAGATGGTIVIEVLEDLAPRAGQLLRERFDSGQYMEGHAAALYPGTRVELVPKVGPTPFKGEVPPEDEGAVPPGNEEHGILSLNAHEERIAILFAPAHYMDRTWRPAGRVVDGNGVLERVRRVGATGQHEPAESIRVEACGMLPGVATDKATLVAARQRARRQMEEARKREAEAIEGPDGARVQVEREGKRLRSEVESAVSSGLGSGEQESESARLSNDGAANKRQRGGFPAAHMDPLSTEASGSDEEEEE